MLKHFCPKTFDKLRQTKKNKKNKKILKKWLKIFAFNFAVYYTMNVYNERL